MTHECNICGKSFTRVDSLSRHVKSLHSDENNLEFENEMFGSGKKKKFRRPSWKTPPSHHMLTPSKASLNDAHYSCHICDQKFPSRFMLEKHLQQKPSHRKSAEDIIKENSFMQRGKYGAGKIFEKRQMGRGGAGAMFRHPFCMQIVGPSRSGKTHWLSQLLRDRAQHISPPPARVIYCYAHWQPAYDFMQADGIEFHEGLPSSIYINILANCMLVLDDMMDQVVNDKKLLSLCTEGSHHKNISVVFIMQNLFHQGRDSRSMSLNMTYIVLFKLVRDQLQVQTLARQLFPKKTNEFLEYYREMTSRPYGKVILDLHPLTSDDERFIEDKVSFDDDNDDNDSDDAASEYFRKLEKRNDRQLSRQSPHLAEAYRERDAMDAIVNDPALEDHEKASHVRQRQHNFNILMKKANSVPPVMIAAPRVAAVPAVKKEFGNLTTKAEEEEAMIQYEDLPEPTEEERVKDSGDENPMENFVSLSDSEQIENLKDLRSDYNFRSRVMRKRRENNQHPY